MYSSDKGFSLIEVLVAIVILAVGLLALLQTVNIALHYNLENQLRQEAVMLADEQMAAQRVKPFDVISTTSRTEGVSRRVYNGFVSYNVDRNGSFLGTAQTTKKIDIQVRWSLKGKSFSHSISSLVSQ